MHYIRACNDTPALISTGVLSLIDIIPYYITLIVFHWLKSGV